MGGQRYVPMGSCDAVSRRRNRDIQYSGQHAGIEAQVMLGKFASKGAARHTLGIADDLPLMDPKPWMERITAGLAGTHPALPNATSPVPCKRPWWRRLFSPFWVDQ